jgi:hypothetical protein
VISWYLCLMRKSGRAMIAGAMLSKLEGVVSQ